METEIEKVALITGAGAVENAWKPIIRVLEPDYKFEFDTDSSNCFLAMMVYQLRAVALDERPGAKEYLKRILADYGWIKHQICRSLIFAEKHKEITIRKQFFTILDKFIFHKNVKSVQITTNWDTVVDNAVNLYGHSTENGVKGQITTFHLHGSVTSSNSLYLPSEIAKEPYRTKEESIKMMENHASVFKALYDCNQIIIYGLSLDPLDAELSQILSLGWNSPNARKIVIINPDYQRVAKRVKLLLNEFDYKIDVVAYLPDDLETEMQL